MQTEQITDLFRLQDRFLRSTHLERDFSDPRALKGYILTPQARLYAEQLAGGLHPSSGQRAWRITGDFGTGKSSFALFVAHLFGVQQDRLPHHLRRAINFKKLGLARPRLLPVLVTGSHEPLAIALLRSLLRDLLLTCGRGRTPAVIDRIKNQLDGSATDAKRDTAVLELLDEASEHVVTSGKGSGLLILLDELGKFLEYGALHPDRQDVFLLQRLAEAASRSNQTPLFVIGLLHQGFNAYAEHLSQTAQKELEKVAGRFDELLFNQPLEHTALLIADALNIPLAEMHKSIGIQAQRDMEPLLDLGWYGAGFARTNLIEIAPRLYPLHPSVIPLLVKLFSRFGQNERSLFSFLLSDEPFGLRDFAHRTASSQTFYRIHNLYDYARYTFGSRLGKESFRNHWNHIDSLIESFPAQSEQDVQMLKTIGLLNLLDTASLLASDQVLALSVVGGDTSSKTSIRRLKGKRVIYHRGVAGGYCLWPHTSVNLEKAYEDAARALGAILSRVAPCIDACLETRPLVARRHYIETGNLRYFEVKFSPVTELASHLVAAADPSDGRIVIALCETEDERASALRFAQSEELRQRPEILCAVPRPLKVLAKLVQQVQRWEWIRANTPELTNDTFAAEEVSRQLTAARDALQQRINSFVGVHNLTGASELCWFRKAKSLPISQGRELLSYLSAVCDELYPKAPTITNELVNRRSLSSAAAAARMRLIEGIFASSAKPYLGMDATKKPPEMSIYLSILQRAELHRQQDHQTWALVMPETCNDPCNVRPALEHIQHILDSAGTNKVKVSDILRELRRAPFGIRDGLSPVLLSIFAMINEQHIAFYENGSFMREMVGLDLMRLTKLPDTFELQYCKMAGIRANLFERLVKVLELEGAIRKKMDVLDVVRPLCVFAAQLPPFSQKTKNLSPRASAVRTVLLTAKEPSLLLFRDLPAACGFGEFTSEKRSNNRDVDLFVNALKETIAELRMAYPLLQERIKSELIDALGVGRTTDKIRTVLARRAQRLIGTLAEPRLKAFCNRLADIELPESEWLESLGSLVSAVPPTRWTDNDTERYTQELTHLSIRFQRVESITFAQFPDQSPDLAMRLSITQVDGSEADRVVYVTSEDQARVGEIENRFAMVLKECPTLGLAAATRCLWKALSEGNSQ